MNDCLADLNLEASHDRREILRMLVTDSGSMLAVLRRIAELRAPDLSVVPPVDELVSTELRDRYGGKVPPELVVKRTKIGPQNKLLLAILLGRVGKEVPLVELFFANDLSTGTPRRLRELRWEHGGFELDVAGTGHDTRYVLRSPNPRPGVSADYWLRKNIRDSKQLSVDDRLLTLLRAHLGTRVPLEAFAYANPRSKSRGKGQSRDPQYATARRIRALREKGWQVYSGHDKVVEGLAVSEYVMLTLDRIPEYERLKPKAWQAIMQRAGYRCERCGWGAVDGPSQGRKLLEVHHVDPQRARPEDVNDPTKLEALCNVCHDAAS